MPTSSEVLQDLHDVHLPDPVSVWPPAPGWWIVLGVVVAGVLLVRWVWAYRRRRKARRLALAELGAIKQEYEVHKDDQWAVQRLSEIVRRYALAAFPRTEVAGLAGHSWLQFLDRTGRTTQFTEGAGHVLGSGAYRPHPDVAAAEVVPLVERWIQQVPLSTRRNSV